MDLRPVNPQRLELLEGVNCGENAGRLERDGDELLGRGAGQLGGSLGRRREGKGVGARVCGVGRGGLVEEASPVVGLDELRRGRLLKAADAKLDGGASLLQRGHGPREALLYPSVQLIQPPEDHVAGKLEGGIHGAVPKSMALIPVSATLAAAAPENSEKGKPGPSDRLTTDSVIRFRLLQSCWLIPLGLSSSVLM